MHHKEHNTLDLLEQFSHNTQPSNDEPENGEKMMFRELGQLMSKSDQKGSNNLFGIPNFIWYLIMLGMVGYLIKEVFFLNQINTVTDVMPTISKGLNDGANKIVDIESSAHKAIENMKKEER